MPKVSAAHKEARRQQVLDAAFKCFLREGFHHTSMRDICREAGVSVGEIYLHFKSKDEIVEAIWKANQELRTERFDQAMQNESVNQSLEQLLQVFVSKLTQPEPDKNWQLYIQLLAESARNPQIREQIRQGWALWAQQVNAVSRKGLANGKYKFASEANIGGRLWAAIHDGLLLQKIIDPQMDTVKVYELYAKIVRRYYDVDEFTE
jgi:AcrR family transcriptional regulator